MANRSAAAKRRGSPPQQSPAHIASRAERWPHRPSLEPREEPEPRDFGLDISGAVALYLHPDEAVDAPSEGRPEPDSVGDADPAREVTLEPVRAVEPRPARDSISADSVVRAIEKKLEVAHDSHYALSVAALRLPRTAGALHPFGVLQWAEDAVREVLGHVDGAEVILGEDDTLWLILPGVIAKRALAAAERVKTEAGVDSSSQGAIAVCAYPRDATSAPALLERCRELLSVEVVGSAPSEWSYGLLSPDEQRALARLAVFEGTWDLDAAASVCDVDPETLEALAEQSLIDVRAGRFSMPDTIREFGVMWLRDRGEEEELRRRQALYFVERAEELGPRITELEGRERIAALERDSANILAALEWLVTAERAELALSLGGSLRLFWLLRGRAPFARSLLERAVKLDGSVGPYVRGKALSTLATLVAGGGDVRRSEELEREALPLFEQAGDAYGVGRSLLSLAWFAAERSDLETAEELTRKGLRVADQLGNTALRGLAHTNLGLIARKRGDLTAARKSFERSHADWSASGNEVGAAGTLANLATVRLLAGDLAGAEELAEQALALNRAIPYEIHAASDLYLLGLIALMRDEREKAASLLAESLAIHRDLADQVHAADSLEALAATSAPGEAAEAASIWGSVAAFRQRFGLRRPDEASDTVESAIDRCRTELGEERFEEAWASGCESSLEDAVDLALSLGVRG